MKINKLSIQNFYSFKNEEIDLDNYSGLTLIKGINKDTGGSNGSGKSAIIEAIYFGLTGKTIRKSTEDSLVNNQAKKHCKVEIHLTHNGEQVVITRLKKPTKLEFLVGTDNRTQQSVISTQAAIDSHLNINHKVLLASMFFGQSNDLNFLECTAEDKRTIIRNFLNLGDLFEMRDRIRNQKSIHHQAAKVKGAIIEENQKVLKSFDKKIKAIDILRQSVEGKYDEETLSLSLEDVVQSEKDNNERAWHVKDLDRLIKAEESRLAQLSKKLHNPDQVENCTKCGQEITTPFDRKKAEASFAKHNTLFSKYQRERIAYQSVIKVLPISSSEYHKVIEYNQLKKEAETFKDLTVETQEKIALAQKDKEENHTQYEVMRFWEKAFSEQGVIKYIINNILDYFNERCNYYLSYLTNSKYSIHFDEELKEKIETIGKLLPYISLSGGEKRKINLAVTLGLKDLLLLTDKSHVDLLFFDEVAENIDEEGVHGLFNLLQEIKNNKTLFVITHNKHLKTLLDSSPRLTIIKNKGLSTIKK
jgi:DNA repair exonuclease SbcCD ATPase subunit